MGGPRMAEPFFPDRLRCADRTFDVGRADGSQNRRHEHDEGGTCASTERRRPVRLVWSQEFAGRQEAVAVQLPIKK